MRQSQIDRDTYLDLVYFPRKTFFEDISKWMIQSICFDAVSEKTIIENGYTYIIHMGLP